MNGANQATKEDSTSALYDKDNVYGSLADSEAQLGNFLFPRAVCLAHGVCNCFLRNQKIRFAAIRRQWGAKVVSQHIAGHLCWAVKRTF